MRTDYLPDEGKEKVAVMRGTGRPVTRLAIRIQCWVTGKVCLSVGADSIGRAGGTNAHQLVRLQRNGKAILSA